MTVWATRSIVHNVRPPIGGPSKAKIATIQTKRDKADRCGRAASDSVGVIGCHPDGQRRQISQHAALGMAAYAATCEAQNESHFQIGSPTAGTT